MTLKPVASVELYHGADFLVRVPGQSVYLAASEHGQISKIDAKFKPQLMGNDWGNIHAISVSRTGDALAIAHNRKFTITDLELKTQYSAPAPKANKSAPYRVKPKFDSCFFEPNGDYLWCAAPLTMEKSEIQIRNTENWEIIDKQIIDNEIADSALMLFSTPVKNMQVLWMAAGQDGLVIYWLDFSDKNIDIKFDEQIQDMMPPVFSPSGQEFLVLDPHTIVRYSFPEKELLGTCDWPSDNEHDWFGCDIHYLNNDVALHLTNYNRLHLLDVKSMSLKNEVVIEGHEPTLYSHPTLVVLNTTFEGFDTLCTDIFHSTLVEDILIIDIREYDDQMENHKDKLLFFPSQMIIDYGKKI